MGIRSTLAWSSLTGLATTTLALGLAGPVGAAEVITDPASGTVSLSLTPAEQQRALDYWTPERMKQAVPYPMPEVVTPEGAAAWPVDLEQPQGTPAVAPAWNPASGQPAPEPDAVLELNEAPDASVPLAFGAVPTNPLSGPYGPFQRWTMQGKYQQWPRFIHGKLFFTAATGGNFVCSATVINRSTIATAGHCVHSGGTAGWHTNFVFCPAYANGINPAVGCWNWSQASTSLPWVTSSDLDYDYACIVTSTTGTVISNKVGNVTGWAGRAMNWTAAQPTITFGYPQAAPFSGGTIQQTASTEWYEVDMTLGGQVSKYIGSDLTGGASGGGWFLSWRHPTTEVADTDNSSATDPVNNNGPHLNGVNSHKRCRTSCFTPPTATAGTFWQEMGSPPFRDTAAANESEDVFAVCLSHPNNL